MNINSYLEENKSELSRWIDGKEQGRIDIKILPYLKDIENGFFIEAGALDGLFMSNTKILEDLGWNGILIEPAVRAYIKCKQNRKVIVENYALVSPEWKHDQVVGDFFFDGEGGLGAWSGIHRSNYGIKAATLVPCTTLGKLLQKHAIKKVDFFSLDVEGFELEVLKGVDFKETDITYILIEINLDTYSLEEMDAYLAKFGYKNLGCLSGFSTNMEGWDGSHNDYLYGKS